MSAVPQENTLHYDNHISDNAGGPIQSDAWDENDSNINSRQPNVATPENIIDNDDAVQAAAAAEVSVMGLAGISSRQQRNQAGDEAVLGAANSEGMVGAFEIIDKSAEEVKKRFIVFLLEYCECLPAGSNDDGGNLADGETQYVYPYQEQATQMAQAQKRRHSMNTDDEGGEKSGFENTLFLDFQHLMNKDYELADAIKLEYCRFEPFLRMAIKSFVLDMYPELNNLSSTANEAYFLAIHNSTSTVSLRKLRTGRIGRLSCVSGTVTRTSDVRPELLIGTFRCNKCGLVTGGVHQQYHYTRPTLCRNPRCHNKMPTEFTLEIEDSVFVDWQKLRVQENSDEIPPGSMPRSIDVIVRNEMVERAKAGDKCVFTGSLVVLPDGSALARAGEAPRATAGRREGPSEAATGGGGGISGLQALGVRELTYRTCFVASSVIQADALSRISNENNHSITSILFGKQTLESHDLDGSEVVMEYTQAERDDLRRMKETPRLYEKFAESIAPATFGHKEVKKGILLMLLGGVHKTTEDGIKLRGDINVCIVGDPSTAKSQFLKYVHSFLPARAVYTSGKASSAAGLTAAVQRDQDTGEYCIEAGALMLADNGHCMIDEFDKMDPSDQVAIHEAMEQQTISITKAGIQATLNARASILAAANPIYGRYDRTRTLKANVALSAPILSRFDLFFVVLDDCNPETDTQVARHILKVHRCEEETVHNVPFTMEQMQRYIRAARTLNPGMDNESQKVLVDCYRKLRQGDTLGRSRSAYRITVRQLESLVRLSEALARLHFDDTIRPSYVREAFRLLRTSIIRVETSDIEMENDDDDNDGHDNDGGDVNMHRMEPKRRGGDQHTTFDEMNDEIGDNGLETQLFNNVQPGEYGSEEQIPSAAVASNAAVDNGSAVMQKKGAKRNKKKTKISFEEYEAITNAIATHLRSLEPQEASTRGSAAYEIEEDKKPKSTKWHEVVDWYLEQCERDIGASEDALHEMRKKINLVIRRLVYTDSVLVTVGDPPKNKKQEQQASLAVHPNYVVS